MHLGFAEVLGAVVSEAPFAGLLVDNEHPIVRVGDVDEEGVVALGDGDVSDHEIGIGVQGSGGVGSGAPYGVVRIVADKAILGEDFAFAALYAGRRVSDGDFVAADGG